MSRHRHARDCRPPPPVFQPGLKLFRSADGPRLVRQSQRVHC